MTANLNTVTAPEVQATISIDRILFATDFSPATEPAFSYAAAIAGRYHSKLYAAHVISLDTFDLLDSDAAIRATQRAHEEAERKLARLLEQLHLQRDRYEIVIAEGSASEGLLNIIERNRIDLAVLGTHGRRAFRKLLMGSIAEEVFRTAPCPVLTVGPKTPPATPANPLRHILYPVEFSPDLSDAARYAVSLAAQYGATLTVMNVWEQATRSEGEPEQAAEEFRHWLDRHVSEDSDLRGRIRFHIGFGRAAESILGFVGEAGVDMIVMPVRRLDPVIAAHLPTSDTAHELVSRAPCPVLTVR